jgi:ElaA protein
VNDVQFEWLPFANLSLRQLHDLFRLRQEVFVVEQRCAYLDIDGKDVLCWHGLGTLPDGTLVASARLVPPGVSFPEPPIGRVVSAPTFRRFGYGRALMRSAIEQVKRLYPGQEIQIGAQRYLERFYESFGFVTKGKPYLEDGIEHVHMIRGA